MAADIQAQQDYDSRLALFVGINGKGAQSEAFANQLLGDNALKKVLDQFGPWDGGLIDELEISPQVRDRLAKQTYQETVAAMAMARSALYAASEARRYSLMSLTGVAALLIIQIIAVVF